MAPEPPDTGRWTALPPGEQRTPYRRPRAALRPRGRRPDFAVLAAISLGGGLGTMLRYGLAQLVPPAGPGRFPWATFAANVSGSFLLGLVLTLLLERFPPSRFARPFLATGVLGAYTTYSTFAVETDLLIRRGEVAVAGAYAAGSLAAGLLAVWGGILVARARRPHPPRGGRS